MCVCVCVGGGGIMSALGVFSALGGYHHSLHWGDIIQCTGISSVFNALMGCHQCIRGIS